jgi:hypothetical protein
MPTSTLRDLITRYAKWQESGGVRQSIMISNRRGSGVSNDESEPDIDHEGDVIAWDFDTSFSDISITSITESMSTLTNANLDYPGETSSTFDTMQTRPLRSATQGPATITTPSMPPSLSLSLQTSTTSEHPLEQLFNDGTVRSATAPPTLRARKDTIPSRPVSPLPPLTVSTTQPSSPDMETHPTIGLGTGLYDLRLPTITPTGPIQIEIPDTEETLRKDPPGVRSRSATVTRSARSDSLGSAAYSTRTPRLTAADPMPQPQSPPRSNRAVSPKPQPPLPTPVPTQLISPINVSKAQLPPLSSPKSASTVPPVPPTSPPKGHIPSKSVPNTASSAPDVSNTVIVLQDHNITKPRSGDLKLSRPTNLTLNVSYPVFNLF